MRGENRPRLNGTVLHAALLFFVVTAVLSVLLNAETLRIHGEFGLGMKKLLVLIFFVSLFALIASALRPGEARNFIPLIVGLGCLSALGSIWEYRTGFNPFYEWGGKIFPGGLDLPAIASEKDATGRIPVLGADHPPSGGGAAGRDGRALRDRRRHVRGDQTAAGAVFRCDPDPARRCLRHPA